jgi:hypothetical protein
VALAVTLQAAAPMAWSQTMPMAPQSLSLAGGPSAGGSTTLRVDLAGGGVSQSLALPKGK